MALDNQWAVTAIRAFLETVVGENVTSVIAQGAGANQAGNIKSGIQNFQAPTVEDITRPIGRRFIQDVIVQRRLTEMSFEIDTLDPHIQASAGLELVGGAGGGDPLPPRFYVMALLRNQQGTLRAGPDLASHRIGLYTEGRYNIEYLQKTNQNEAGIRVRQTPLRAGVWFLGVGEQGADAFVNFFDDDEKKFSALWYVDTRTEEYYRNGRAVSGEENDLLGIPTGDSNTSDGGGFPIPVRTNPNA